MKRADWLYLALVLFVALAGYLYIHRDECIVCKGSLGFIPKEGVPNGG